MLSKNSIHLMGLGPLGVPMLGALLTKILRGLPDLDPQLKSGN